MALFIMHAVGIAITEACVGLTYPLGLARNGLVSNVALNGGIALATLFRYWSHKKWAAGDRSTDRTQRLRVPRSFRLKMPVGRKITCAQAASTLAASEVRSAGNGPKAIRWYGWSWLAAASPQLPADPPHKDSLGLDESQFASTRRSPATPSWSWPPWPSAPSPPPCSTSAPAPRLRRQPALASHPR